MAIETYLLSAFTTSGGVVNAGSLEEEIIDDPSITIQVLGVTVTATEAHIDFKAALSAGQKTSLNAVVAAHTGEASTSGLAADGSTLVTVSGSSGGTVGGLHFEAWTEGVVIDSPTNWISAYSKTGGGVLYDMVWQLNSDDLEVRISLDDQVVLEASISTLSKDLRLTSGGAAGLCWPWICEYNTKRWRFYPPTPMQFTTCDVSFRRTSNGTKKIERGITLWKELLT